MDSYYLGGFGGYLPGIGDFAVVLLLLISVLGFGRPAGNELYF